jgi:uncharacterized protein (TIGR02266 family)
LANTDNRKSQRSPVTLRIKFKSANLEQFIERYAVDVSQGGIFIRTKEPLPVGTTMRFEFQLRDESPLITGEGTVVWIREPNAGQAGVAPGMGVRFDRLTESSQSVLDEILAHKAKRAASSAATQNTDPPTRVASAATLRKAVAASRDNGMPFTHDDEPADAFEQSTKVHSLEELASLSARPDTGDPLAGAAEEYEEDKTKVYPAMAKPAARPNTRPGSRASARPTGPAVDLGLPGVTQPLPRSPAMDSDVELGHASFEEEFDDLELPVDKDVELGMAGPTKPLQAERLVRSDEVELGRAGTTSPAKQPQPAARPTAPGKPIALGQSGAHDPMSDVPLPEPGHFDLGMAGPTMPLPTERLGRGAELELGAAGTTDEAEEAALQQAARAKSAAAERAAAAQASAAATRAASPQAPNLAAPPAPPAPPAQLARIAPPVDPLEDSQELLETAESALGALIAQNQPEAAEASVVDELAARRAGRASEQMPAMAPPPDLDEGIDEEDDGIEEAVTTRPPASADRRVVAASPAVRVSTRTGTDAVEKKKGFPLLPLFAAAVVLAIIGGGAFLLATERGGEILAKLTGGTVEPPAEPGTVATPTPPPQPVPVAVPPDAAAQAVAEPEPEIVMEEEPEVPVELVEVQVRSTPPGATAALVDGDQSGPTPMTFKVDKAKKHRVRISQPGFVSQEIELDPAQPKPAPVTLAAIPRVIRTESTPPGATIYVNGRRVPGHSPNEFPLPPDLQKRKKLTISFRIPGYDKLDIDIAPAFQAEGEAMVQTVQGTLVKSAPRAPATTPTRPQQQPATGDEVTLPPEEGAGQQGGGQAPPPAEPPKADTPPAAPPGQTP